MSDPADDVAAMTKPATAKPAMTPPAELPAQTANTKIATCDMHVIFQSPLSFASQDDRSRRGAQMYSNVPALELLILLEQYGQYV